MKRTRIYRSMPFPYEKIKAEICAKCDCMNLWTDGIKFARPSIVLWKY